jgi:hypothetical protein
VSASLWLTVRVCCERKGKVWGVFLRSCLRVCSPVASVVALHMSALLTLLL